MQVASEGRSENVQRQEDNVSPLLLRRLCTPPPIQVLLEMWAAFCFPMEIKEKIELG